MKILLLATHPTLEYDELGTLFRIGNTVQSTGYYLNPNRPLSGHTRGPISMTEDLDFIEKFSKINPGYQPGADNLTLSKDLIKDFDIILGVYNPCFFEQNWEIIKDKLVIWRTLGHGSTGFENRMKPFREKGIKIVRISKTEENIPDYIGGDCIIKGSIDENYFKGWSFGGDKVLTVQKRMKKHPFHSEYYFFDQVTSPFNRAVAGLENEDIPYWTGSLTSEELLKEYQKAGVYFSTCSKTAPVTYTFAEALTAGVPLVTLGPKRGNDYNNAWKNSYEQYNYIEKGVNGFWSDDLNEIREFINLVLKDKRYAESISMEGRKTGINHFGQKSIEGKWREFLTHLM